MRSGARKIMTIIAGAAVALPAWGAEAHVVPSKLRAKFSGKKITVKGKVIATGEWPVTLRVELLDAQDRVVSSASDSLRAPDSFQIELKPPRGQKFERGDLAQAQVQYSLMRERRKQGEQKVALAQICPNLTKSKHKWWPW